METTFTCSKKSEKQTSVAEVTHGSRKYTLTQYSLRSTADSPILHNSQCPRLHGMLMNSRSYDSVSPKSEVFDQ